MWEVAVAGESRNSRAQIERSRAKNVAGGRPHRHVLKLSDAEESELSARAAAAGGISIQRLLVERELAKESPDVGRAHAAQRLLDLQTEVLRAGNNLNQLTRYAHQERELGEDLDVAIAAVVRAAVLVETTARWVMGLEAIVPESALPPAAEHAEAGADWLDDLDAGPQDFA